MSAPEPRAQLGMPLEEPDGPCRRVLVAPHGARLPAEPAVGVDEAGRGPLAGPVVAAAVVLAEPNPVPGLTDSKKLSAKRREALHDALLEGAAAAGLGWAEPAEIDAVNILQATHRAMERAVAALRLPGCRVRIDGNSRPAGLPDAACLVGGDLSDPAISAASILAKVTRDRWMAEHDARYPGYGFAAHKGYGTAAHREALERLGPSPIHRRSFKVVSRNARE
ncbi:MAG: ribonuclease HII [Thiohalorhabdus sp.]|uniref:ribonuclease HII n=1 Tax=Thiohalorhabdus sp. TaxID=3094134 RepID=UPI00398090A8